MFKKIILFFVFRIILCFPQDSNIYFRDESTEIGSRCRSPEGFGSCVLDTDCRDSDSLYKNGRHPEICFFEGERPVICCPSSMVLQDEGFLDDFLPKRKETNQPNSNLVQDPNDLAASSSPGPSGPSGTSVRMSTKMCEEYSKNYTNELHGPYVDTAPYVVGGRNATLGEFPHMAILGNPGTNGMVFFCGGTLISNRYILTAAHCVFAQVPTIIRLGELDTTKDDDGATPRDYGVDEIIPHVDYKISSVYHDIALIRLNESVEFYKLVRPACLPQNTDLKEWSLDAYGWGHTEFAGHESPRLQVIQLGISSEEVCKTNYPSTRRFKEGLIDSQICAGDFLGIMDTCQGDSGGPLSRKTYKNEIFTYVHQVVGVTSFGKGCGAKIPAIYTNVHSYLDWIEKIVWNV